MTAFFCYMFDDIYGAVCIVLIMMYTLLILRVALTDCVLQHKLHIDHVEPSVEFVAHLLEV